MEPEPTGNNKTEASFIPGSIATVRIGSVPVRLHFTFVLLFVFVAFAGIGERQSPLVGVLYIAALFASVTQ